MPGLSVADTFGALRAVKRLHIASGGVFVPVKALSVWDPVDAEFKPVWPGPPSITKLTITPTADWRTQTVTWDSDPAATSYVLRRGTSILYQGTGESYSWQSYAAGLAPGSTQTLELEAINAQGSVRKTATVVLPQVPAPATFTRSNLDYNSVDLTWASVPGATAYRVLNAKTGYSVVFTTSMTTAFGVNLAQKTAYSFVVVALAGSYASKYSAALSFTSPAKPGPDPGVYTIKPATNATWQTGESGGQGPGWRPTSDDLYHGNGGSVSSRGTQTAHFFYGTRISDEFPDGLGGATVTRLQVWIKRTTSGGSSSNQQCRWMLHKYASKPSGSPTSNWSSVHDNGALEWGEGAWVDLPTSWGAHLVNGTWRGLAWGNVAGRYMIADSNLGLTTPSGTLKITVA